LKAFLKNNLIIIIPYFLLLLAAVGTIFSFKKNDIHLYLNSFVGNFIFDKFNYFITYLGDGNVAVVILLLLLIYNVRIGVYCTVTFIIASLFSVSLKHFLFDDVNRPTFVFRYFEHLELKLVDGVQTYIHNSFPSGHATQAFAIFISLGFCLPDKKLKISLLILATLTAYSRVYLSQHWLQDITAGSVVGFLFSTLFYFLIYQHKKMALMEKGLFKLKKD